MDADAARLDALRAEIARCDEEVLAAVARRLDAAAELGRIKSARGLPVRNFPVEAQVLERLRAGCAARGVDPELGDAMAGLLIDHAVKLQSGLVDRPAGGEQGEAVVVGGRGKMGRWLCAYLRAGGHRVRVLDPASGPADDDLEAIASLDEAAGAGLLVLATPISSIPALLGRLDPNRHTGLVLDIASLKSPLVEPLRGAATRGLRVASLHPMFGPDVAHLIGRNVLFCDCGAPGALAEAKQLFVGVGAQLVDVPLDEHDRHMGYVLGLAHLVNILYGRVLGASGLDYRRLGEVASTTFGKQNATARDVLRENPDLYFEIQQLNATTPALAGQLHAALDEILGAVAAGDRETFRRIMDDGRNYFLGG
ncbi:MAG: bifunctional chorismate mutase/prephenate dehydrogenase [Candidatus Latescibacteria bacterium]|nr:bifunctional chorismate mutase/prephenate dehydrogenase [Candidatus Latescibacterota bacterium]